jgi:hypothetical protein
MHLVQTIANSKFCWHVYFFARSLSHFKTFVLQERHCGDDIFIWSVAKFSFVTFFIIMGRS